MAFERGISSPAQTPQPREERILHTPEQGNDELPPSIQDIGTFFRYIRREDLLGPDTARDRHAREYALIKALDEAKTKYHADQTALTSLERKARQHHIDHIRKLIWRLSTAKENSEPSKDEATASAKQIAKTIESTEYEWTESPEDQHDWEEARRERAECYQLLATAFEHDVTGNTSIPHSFLASNPHILSTYGPVIKLKQFLEQVEYEYGSQEYQAMTAYDHRRRKIEEQKLQELRRVRDELYTSYLFPNLAKAMHASERHQKTQKPQKRRAA